MPSGRLVVDSTLLHCSWCGHRLSEDGGAWYHCAEHGTDPDPIEVDCRGATAWPMHPDLETGVRWEDAPAASGY